MASVKAFGSAVTQFSLLPRELIAVMAVGGLCLLVATVAGLHVYWLFVMRALRDLWLPVVTSNENQCCVIN